VNEKPSVPQYLAELIEDALDAARMERMGGIDQKKYDEARETTRLYRESWLIEPLLTALRAIHGDEDAIRWAKERVSINSCGSKPAASAPAGKDPRPQPGLKT